MRRHSRLASVEAESVVGRGMRVLELRCCGVVMSRGDEPKRMRSRRTRAKECIFLSYISLEEDGGMGKQRTAFLSAVMVYWTNAI